MVQKRISTLGIREQLAWIRLVYPSYECRVERDLLICRGRIQPALINHVYDVRIDYRVGNRPKIVVENPVLHRRKPDECIPHTYPKDEPCLYGPGSGEWRADKKLALTIIPWLSEWLFFYEVWLAAGDWKGGGIHPARFTEAIDREKTPED
jgi:hypothetical protein